MVEKFEINPKSRAEQILESRNAPPEVTVPMYKAVSDYRKNVLADEVDAGVYREGSSHINKKYGGNGRTQAGVVAHSGNGLYKQADAFTGSSLTQAGPTTAGIIGAAGSSWRGAGGTVRQVPEVYSPLWLNSNLNLPRDRATVLAWCRSFFALNPIVQNSLTLHSTYPISKLSIKCRNEKVEKFFAGMIEEIDLMNICVQIAQEYWTLGEAFVYAELDDRTAKWSRLLLQNPDYITVKRSAIAGEPIISMRPDENLRRIVTGNRPSDIEQRRQLDPAIIEHVRRGENIPLNNFYVTHLARRISPYEIRGTGLPVSVFRQLMLFDQLRESKFAQAHNLVNPLTLVKIGNEEFKPTPTDLDAWRDVFECHDEETEVLTDQGFKKFDEVIEYAEVMDGTYNHSHISYAAPKSGFKVACFNPDNEQLEYHKPSAAHVYNYDGEMYHFHNDKMDIKVTPNHDMWVSERGYEYHGHRSLRKTIWKPWKKVKAEDLTFKEQKRFRSEIIWKGNDNLKTVNICGKDISIELYLEFLGYVISEGCVYSDDNTKFVSVCQNTTNKDGTIKEHFPIMKKCAESFAEAMGMSNIYEYYKPLAENRQENWTYKITSVDLYNYFKNEIGAVNGTKAKHKRIPKWILNLSPRLLNILLTALVRGDGSNNQRKVNKKLNGYAYYTASKQLSDDVYEIAYKCGFVPTMFVRDDDNYLYRYGKMNEPRCILYTVLWSNSGRGNCPYVYPCSTDPRTKIKTEIISKEQYNGKVWCFTVPTGLFITRRNGKITIQGNSAQYDKDFKIFTHNAVTVERVGAATGIYDISGDITQLIKEIYIGLMVPAVLMDGQDTTYANGSVALDVLRQRYMQFRNMMGSFLKRKIFAPIAKLNDFYEYIDGEKVLMVPDVDWNHMSLFDMADYIGNLTNLSQSGPDKKVSLQTLYRSLGLDYTEERRKMRYEDINDAIRTRELAILSQLPLNKLRSLSADDEIKELVQSPLPGETPYEEAAAAGTGMDDGGMGGMGMPTTAPTGAGLGGMSMPTPKPPSAPVGRPSSGLPQPPGGGGNIGPGGIPKPSPPAK